ncbi:uncharacterized protein [Rutidosis leptorrhynchoides]|uniref:uncharacterized protein n=1 Tax=Rutidosis leptorrhynchoides TaxID=125765 RepID=UPI003A9A04BE
MAVRRWLNELRLMPPSLTTHRPAQTIHSQENWMTPSHGTLKINFDASFVYGDSSNRIGIIARNEQGKVIYAESAMLGPAENALHAETKAALHAITWAASMNVTKIDIEGDCLYLINDLRRNERSFASCGLLIDEIKNLAKTFSLCNFKFVKREANKVAHSLATLSYNMPVICFTFNSLPYNVASLVLLDLN